MKKKLGAKLSILFVGPNLTFQLGKAKMGRPDTTPTSSNPRLDLIMTHVDSTSVIMAMSPRARQLLTESGTKQFDYSSNYSATYDA